MIINKHLIRSMIYPIVVMLVIFLFLIWITQSLRFLDLIVTRGIDFISIFFITSSLTPSLINIVLPIAVCVGAIFYYNKLLCDNEILALKASGFSHNDLIKPLKKLCLITTLIGYFLSLYIVPKSNSNFNDQKTFFQKQYAAMILREGVFSEPIKGLVIYIDQIINNQTFKGIMLSDKRDPKKDVTLIAKEAKVISAGDQTIFDLLSGNRQEKTENKISILYFDNFPINISNYISIEEKRWKEPSERTLFELLKPETEKPEMQGKIYAELNNRLLWPILNFVLPIVGVSVMLAARYSKHGYYTNMSLAGLFILIIIVMIMVVSSLISRHILFALLGYIFILLSILGSFLYLRKLDK